MSVLNFEKLFEINARTRWVIIVLSFVLIAALDFSTPTEYVMAYLYAIPILVSVSFLRPTLAKTLLVLAMIATMLNTVIPQVVLNIPSVIVNRLLAALSILISAFFMVRYIRYQSQLQQQEQLLNTERNMAEMREDLTATLTHDLRTPLLGQQKTLQYFSEASFGPLTPEQADVLAALLRSNNRILDLVETLLSVYRNDNLGVDLTRETVNLDDLIADLLTEFQHLALERRIQLEYLCAETPLPAQADALQIKRVLANLIHNALNYTPANGAIKVRLLQKGNEALVEVLDSGPGLSEQDLEKVFHRFYRADGNRQVVGTGLGLYLSRQIIVACRGRIWTENVRPVGCKFTFTLPLAESGASHD
jgi:two-component system NarL family sensor kinase